jgi:hypothetical protein
MNVQFIASGAPIVRDADAARSFYAQYHSGKTHIAPLPRVRGHLSGRKESRIDYLPIYILEMPLARNQGLSTQVLQAEYPILKHRVTAGWRAASPKGPLDFQKHGTASSDVKIDALVGHRFIARPDGQPVDRY